MVVVIDTNTLISALLSPTGFPSQVINLWSDKQIEVPITSAIKQEYLEVLNEMSIKYEGRISQADLDKIKENLTVTTTITQKHPDYIPKDSEDNKFIECAIEAYAEIIITGNKKHFLENEYEGIPVLTANEFIQAWATLQKTNATSPLAR